MIDLSKSPARIYGVLDLKGGQVVHAVAGRRACYRPICSALTESAEPQAVARAMINRWGIHDVYVADLDALDDAPPDHRSVQRIAGTGMRVLFDAGVQDARQAEPLLEQLALGQMLHGLVVALESTRSADAWPELVEVIGQRRAVFSLDLQDGRPLVQPEQLAGQSPSAIAELAWQSGFRRLIVLDLARVGVAAGPSTASLCRDISEQRPWGELISGGGIRDNADIRQLTTAGCHSLLIASALHKQPPA
jgi:phosphoribosylformimino-5-aminoimidazole carboxamide ribotide isomerase